MKEVKTLYEFKHNLYVNLSIAMERKNMNCKVSRRAIYKSDDYISRIIYVLKAKRKISP